MSETFKFDVGLRSGYEPPTASELIKFFSSREFQPTLALSGKPLGDAVVTYSQDVLRAIEPFGLHRFVLFGSVARGEETIESDLDFFFIDKPSIGLFADANLAGSIRKALRLSQNIELDRVYPEALELDGLLDEIMRDGVLYEFK